MLIGKSAPAVSGMCTSTPDRIEIRGLDLAGDLMGRFGFTEFFYFLVTGERPSEQQRFFLDLLLISIAEHGLTPTAQAARMTLAAAPDSLQSAVAAGILGCGTVVLGSSELCAQILSDAAARVDGGASPAEATLQIATEIRSRRGKVPGFGHPIHHPVDPRTERILALADERGVSGRYVELLKAFRGAVAQVWGKPMPLNVSGPIAAVLMDLGFPATMTKAIPILARTAGLLGHLAEEQRRPIGFLLAHHAEEAVAYDPTN
ncbi:citryl-CoA lyase [Alsobacter soli]|uniref:citrate synthase (unknown stereospecificity) n=1 Tax=Alsobacter soli TaxID=2109933 RepID=A0A2T1HY26_9HYPH|nr:citryl-CoA lyase [Alsobacter soli]PSC06597.1 citryl-CoA lyase [Alsobacter soli]